MPDLLQIPRSMIRVDSSTNPRKDFDEGDLADLVKSIEHVGLLSSLTVRPIIEGDATEPTAYALVAGHRRLMALDSIHGTDDFVVPSLVTDSSKDVASIVENIVRADLSPVEEALHYKQFIDVGYTPQGVSELCAINIRRVNERLAIMDLQPQIVDWIAKGELTTSCVKSLSAIQKVSPQLALACAKEARKKPDVIGTLAKRPGELIEYLASKQDSPWTRVPGTLYMGRLKSLVKAHKLEGYEDVIARLGKFSTAHQEAYLHINGRSFDRLLGAGEIIATDKKAGHGVLVAPGEEFLAVLDLELREKEQFRAAEAKRQVEARARKVGVDPTAPDYDQAKQKDAEAKARRIMAERAREDRGHNLELGRKLLVERVKRSNDDAIRLVIVELLAALRLGHVAKTGLRLVLEQLQEVTRGKDGKDKVTYLLSVNECEEAARNWVMGAESTDEMLHRCVAVLLAAEGSLQTAVAESARMLPPLSANAKDLRRKLVEPYIAGGDHTERVKAQWTAIDEGKTDPVSGSYCFPPGLHLIGAATTPDQAPTPDQA
jgi:ParB/RepB/Spo0J family partition protein